MAELQPFGLNYSVRSNRSLTTLDHNPSGKRSYYSRHQQEIDQVIGTSVGVVFAILAILVSVYFIVKCYQSRNSKKRRRPLRQQSTVMSKIPDSDNDDIEGQRNKEGTLLPEESPTRKLEKTVENLKMMGIL